MNAPQLQVAESRVLALVVLIILSSFALSRYGPSSDGPRGATNSGAQWIWAQSEAANEQPTTFSLVRDFELPTLAAAHSAQRDFSEAAADDAPSAHLLLASDADVLVYLNGLWLGALDGAAELVNRTTDGAGPLQLLSQSPVEWQAPVAQQKLALAPFVRPGHNRLVLEVRSPTGAGAVLAELRSGEPGAEETRVIAASGPDWLVSRRPPPGLRAGWLDLQAAQHQGKLEQPFRWGTPPLGRYSLTERLASQNSGMPLDERMVMPRSIEHQITAAAGEDAIDAANDVSPTPGFELHRVQFAPPSFGYLHLGFDRPPQRIEVRELSRTQDARPTLWRQLVLAGATSWRAAAARTHGTLEVRLWGADLRSAGVHPAAPSVMASSGAPTEPSGAQRP